MSKKLSYERTMTACFTGYFVQAVVNNFLPLLFVTFHTTYGISFRLITLLITVNFVVQISVDLLSAFFVDKIGYRVAMVIAHFSVAAGFILLMFLPNILPNPYIGILICVVLYAIGGGLLEVLVSPIVESCPTKNKEAAMSLLHSFYSWGQVGAVLLSTIFFVIFGIQNWRIMAVIWAIVPLYNMFVFMRVPIAPLLKDGDKGMSLRQLCGSGMFWILMLMMFCAGSCEMAVSQWASTFAERGLGISKAMGDLAGPMFFAVMMGISRTIFGKMEGKIPLEKYMIGSGALCVIAYLLVSLSPIALIGFLGCGLCGFSVGLMWPGTFSVASLELPRGGTAMFALLALAGDVGCGGGPTIVGMISSAFENNLHLGILCGTAFPVLLLAGFLMKRIYKRKRA